MGKLPRKTAKRLWYAGLLVLWLLPFTLASIALADSALVTSDGQGWYWKNRPRYGVPITDPAPGQAPPVGGDLYCYPVTGSPCSTQWKNEHMYVGWDGHELKPEAISAVHFQLNTIPSGSTITRFIFTIKQHPSGREHNNTPNVDAPAKHGIVVCPWPEFSGGPREGPDYLDPQTETQRKCGDSIIGTPSITDAQKLALPDTTVNWTFDLSSIAADWAGEVNPGVSIEPDSPSTSPVSWITSFHWSSVFHDPATGNVTSPTPRTGDVPGLFAEVTYLLPSGAEESGLVSGEFTSEFDSSGDALAFGDTEGLAGDLGASSEPSGEAEAPEQPNLTAGVFEGKPAGFWAYPLAWITALLGLALTGFAAKVLQADPGQGRPPGAAAALMRGGPTGG